ncbi:MAG TPA: isoprenylcysteine carboxylmethyltransferase family protein [Planctomycetota bacterium]|nr:isoprenylcysteine carboxylmethyltransferase family protein [Planctomycetota bacterium]
MLTLLFGVAGYTVFFATFLYLIGFVSGLLVPTSLDGDGVAAPFWPALLVDTGFVLLFGVQHCIMARPWFKRRWTRIVPRAIERTVFMLATCAILCLMFWQWRAMPAVLWSLDGAAAIAVHAVAFAGWGIVLLSTFLIDHFDLFGLRQTWLAFRGLPYSQKPFAERSLYRRVRHPLMLGFLMAFWAAPVLTVGHLVFGLAFTSFILIVLIFEERDLVAPHGDAYREYQRRVPKLLPLGGRGAASTRPPVPQVG